MLKKNIARPEVLHTRNILMQCCAQILWIEFLQTASCEYSIAIMTT
jgi:hypothetical protein